MSAEGKLQMRIENEVGQQFVPYRLSIRLKRLGYDLSSLGYYAHGDEGECIAPTWDRAFEFFRDKHNLWHRVVKEKGYDEHWSEIEDMMTPRRYSKDILRIPGSVMSYYHAQLRCLEKMIDIVEKHKSE